jgi:hypothetical protein
MTDPASPAAAQDDAEAQPDGAGGGDLFDANYYRRDLGVPYERSEHWLKFFGDVADGLVRDFHPLSVMDAGCAMGFLVEALRQRGVEAYGVDVSDYAISKVDKSVAEFCKVASLAEPLPERYDLIVCIEVIEHIPAEDAEKVLDNLTAATDRLVLSTSPTDYREATHLNVQSPEVWSELLARRGFLRDTDRDLSYITPWAALYERTDEPLARTVRRYDRSWWRLRHEVSEVRTALLLKQKELAEMEKRKDPPETPEHLVREIERQNEELLRLRDLLIGKDAELGIARGQAAALQDQNMRIVSAVSRIHPRMPRLLGMLTALRRRFRRGG